MIIIEYENAYQLYIGYNPFQIRFFHYFYLTLVFTIPTRRVTIGTLTQAAISLTEKDLEKLRHTHTSLGNRVYLILQNLYKKNHHLPTQSLS